MQDVGNDLTSLANIPVGFLAITLKSLVAEYFRNGELGEFCAQL